jgi:hypothetical protein
MQPMDAGVAREAPNPASARRMKNVILCEFFTKPQAKVNIEKRNIPRMNVYFLEMMSAIRPDRSRRQPYFTVYGCQRASHVILASMTHIRQNIAVQDPRQIVLRNGEIITN